MAVAMGAIKTRLNSLRMIRKKQDFESKRVLLSTLAMVKWYVLVGKGSNQFGVTQKTFINAGKENTVHRHDRALKETTVKALYDSATTIPQKKLVNKNRQRENAVDTVHL